MERLAADVEGPRRDAGIVERPGVGQDRQVHVRGDLDRGRDLERADEVVDHLRAGSGARVEPVDLAVAGVAGMVVDVDHEILIESLDAGSREIAALHDDRGVERAVHAPGDLDLRHAGKHHQRSRRGVMIDDRDLLAERAERIGHRQLRADRIAVRPGMRGEHEALPRGDGVDDLLDFRRGVLPAITAVRSAGREPSRSVVLSTSEPVDVVRSVENQLFFTGFEALGLVVIVGVTGFDEGRAGAVRSDPEPAIDAS